MVSTNALISELDGAYCPLLLPLPLPLPTIKKKKTNRQVKQSTSRLECPFLPIILAFRSSKVRIWVVDADIHMWKRVLDFTSHSISANCKPRPRIKCLGVWIPNCQLGTAMSSSVNVTGSWLEPSHTRLHILTHFEWVRILTGLCPKKG